ncbi:MAG: deoxyribose-phosphate aldolase [Acidobacteria bacterium]|nr:deoxyribose-phosphate aldolase [Acidobacteriota bacterium]
MGRPRPLSGEGHNHLDLVCPGCTQRCPQTCSKKTANVIAAGADRVSASHTLTRVDAAIARLIDHTILKPDATRADVEKVCAEAVKYSFASVCVNAYWVPLVAKLLAGSPVKVCTVVGFPLGATTTATKVHETREAIKCGAQEIDMVLNVGALRSGDHERVKQDIHAVAEAAHAGGAILKVILETCLLDDNQKAIACTLAKLAGADFVKTSTGFSTSGATAHDIALMRSVVGPDIGVKASGGIRTREDLDKMAAAGASRIGASASVKIVEGATPPAGGY